MINLKHWVAKVFVLTIYILSATCSFASDIDTDGISRYKDDAISKHSELGDPEPNVNFIILNAKSKAKVLSRKGDQAAKGGGSQQPGSANLNSVILGAGGTVLGDIIIIDESRGNNTVIAE